MTFHDRRVNLPNFTEIADRVRGTVTEDSALSSSGRLWFLLFAAYLVMPIWDFPGLTVSLSAPIFALVALDVLSSTRRLNWHEIRIWIILAYLFWFAAGLSLYLSVLREVDVAITSAQILKVLRLAYWMLVFLLIPIIITNSDILPRLMTTLAMAVVALALLRIYEGLTLGRWDILTRRFVTKNTYGILFSTFVPFVMLSVVTVRRENRPFTLLAVAIVGLAAMANGSRAGWFAVIVGLVVFLVLYRFGGAEWARWIWLPAGLLFGFFISWNFLPTSVSSFVQSQSTSLQELEDDRSYAIRQVQIQKGRYLLERNPIVGVGFSRWEEVGVPAEALDLPQALVVRRVPVEDLVYRNSHNSYVQLAAEMGLIGVIPFGAINLLIAIGGLRAAIFLAQRGEPWGIAVYASLVSQGVHMWSLAGLFGTGPWFIFGLNVAVIVYAERLRRSGAFVGRPAATTAGAVA